MDFKKLQAIQKKLDKKTSIKEKDLRQSALILLSLQIGEILDSAWEGDIIGNRFVQDQDYRGIIGYYDKRNGFKVAISYKEAHHLALVDECANALSSLLRIANCFNFDISEYDLDEFFYTADISEWYFEILHHARKNLETPKPLISICLNCFKDIGINEKELEEAYCYFYGKEV